MSRGPWIALESSGSNIYIYIYILTGASYFVRFSIGKLSKSRLWIALESSLPNRAVYSSGEL